MNSPRQTTVDPIQENWQTRPILMLRKNHTVGLETNSRLKFIFPTKSYHSFQIRSNPSPKSFQCNNCIGILLLTVHYFLQCIRGSCITRYTSCCPCKLLVLLTLQTVIWSNMGESGQSGTMSRPQDFLEYLCTKTIFKGYFCITSMY